jgi:hypothetical protein
MKDMKKIHLCTQWRNTPLGAWADKCHRQSVPPAARKFACLFGLPIATAMAVAELAGYVMEVPHD